MSGALVIYSYYLRAAERLLDSARIFQGDRSLLVASIRASLHGSASDKVKNNHDQCDHDQDMNEPARDVKGKTAYPEEYKENSED